MSLTSLIRPLFNQRLREIDRYEDRAEEIQRAVLERLTSRAADTEWGNKYGYSGIRTYEEFASKVPVNTYEDLKTYIDRMRRGEKHILWPGQVKWYAKSRERRMIKVSLFPFLKKGFTTPTTPGERMP